MMTRREACRAGATAAAVPLLLPSAQQPAPPDPALFFQAIGNDARVANAALESLSRQWSNGYTMMLVELLRIFVSTPREEASEQVTRTRAIQQRVLEFLAASTGKSFGADLRRWARWAWSLDYAPHPEYAGFKGFIYSKIDPRMAEFFRPGVASKIRLDQVEWGGVKVNGIPPLVNPAMITAAEAKYLKNGNVVFGVELGGQAKAYPKRILAWHEMARDRVGGVDLAIVYCTLCGTVIPYRTTLPGGRGFTLGTSGLLYESSKLMFDEETKSLWPTLQGRPAIGVLAGQDIQLTLEPVVTTTWGEWRTAHPDTLVLSPETGHTRDYSEGAAYRDYFSTDDLMFEVSRGDKRLKNKDEVLAIRLPGKTPLAVAVRLLARNRGLTVEHEGISIAIRSTPGGANRAYVDGKQIAAHQAFWFGWHAQYPEARLIR
jgi:hypothetical protein